MYVLALSLAATTFLGTLVTAQGSAQGFAQEYNIVDGVPCTKQPDESWLCIDGNVNTTVYAIPSPAGSVYVDRLSTFFGLKINCGGSNVRTWFFRPTLGDIPDYSIFQMDCTGLTSVSTVRANNYFEVILGGQDLTFTDAAPCTAGADNGFQCGAINITASRGTINMTKTENDAAIRVTCAAGSSVFFASGGVEGYFRNPSLCGESINNATIVNLGRSIDYPRGGGD